MSRQRAIPPLLQAGGGASVRDLWLCRDKPLGQRLDPTVLTPERGRGVMEPTTSDVVLFAHITLVIVGLALAAVLHTALIMVRGADYVADLRQWPRVIERVEPLLPVAALLILLSGAWLLHLSGGEFTWSAGWVTASLVGLLVAELAGAAMVPRSRALRRTIRAVDPGPVTIELRRRVTDPWLWIVAHAATADFVAIVFLMVVKPSGGWSAIVLIAVTAAGALTAIPFVRRPRGVPPVPAPRGRDEVRTWTRHRS